MQRKPQTRTSSVQGKYLYCVIKEKKPKRFNIQGQDGEKVYILNVENLAIAVSDTPRQDYPFIKEHLTAHQEVIEQVMRQGYDVLPVRYSTVAPDAEYVKEKLLKAKRKELLETFPIVEGRVELGLRAFWKDMPSIFKEAVREFKEIQRAKSQAQRNPNQFKLAQVGELVQKALELKREKDAQMILGLLKKLAVDFKERELLRSSEPMKDAMILSSAFLVAKGNEREFDKRVGVLIKENDKRIRFTYVGPIPPFNFVELHLKV